MKSGFQAGTEDPFAGLESAPAPAPTPTPAPATQQQQQQALSMKDNPLQQQQQQAARPPMASTTPRASASPLPVVPQQQQSMRSTSPVVAPAAGGGVRSPSPMVTSPTAGMTPATGTASVRKTIDLPSPKQVVPTPSSTAAASTPTNAAAAAATSMRSASPVTARAPTPTNAGVTAPAATTAAGGPPKTPPRSSTTGTITGSNKPVTPPRSSTSGAAAAAPASVRPAPVRPTASQQQQIPSGTGIGNSGVRLPSSSNVTSGAGNVTSNASYFNTYEFLAGPNKKEPKRKFYPIERVKPFWALLGLDVYVEQWRKDKDVSTTANKRGGLGGFIGGLGEELQSSHSGEKDGTNSGSSTSGKDGKDDKSSSGHDKSTKAPTAFSAAPLYEQLAKALSFQCHLVQESERIMYSTPTNQKSSYPHSLTYLRPNQIALESCIKLIGMLPHSAGASGKNLDALFLNFINTFVNLLGNLQMGQQLVLPGGWQGLDSAHVCLYILRRSNTDNGNTYSFSVVNTGPAGLEYHPSNFDSTTGRQTKQLCLSIWDIPRDHVIDSTFWVLLFRMQVYPSKRNTPEFLYTKLLPSLNSKPLSSNREGGLCEYYYPPATNTSAKQYHLLALLGLTCIPERGVGGGVSSDAPSSKYSSLLVRNVAVDIAYRGIEDARPGSMDPEDSRILSLAARNLANFASTLDPKEFIPAGGSSENNNEMVNSLGTALNNTWELLDKLLAKLSVVSSKPLDQHSVQIGNIGGQSSAQLEQMNDFGKGLLKNLRTNEGSAGHPFFGRLRRDNYDEVVKALMVSFSSCI